MSKIKWEDSFSVGNAEIDAQHQKWIAIYNKMHESIIMGSAQPGAGAEALKAMQDYASYHFSFEEEYMRKMDYPNLIEHHRIHKDFDNLIYTYYRDTQAGKLVLDSKIMRTLKKWLLEHILREDQKYAQFLKAEK